MDTPIDPGNRWFYRLGGICALAYAVANVIIILLYIPMGAPPDGAGARLAYVAENMAAWWAVLGLSVLTDFLIIPVALSLYSALKGLDKNAMLLAVALMGLFVVLDLPLTWMNYAVIITLSGPYAAATTDAARAALSIAAAYPATVLESNLLFIYNSLTLGVGIFIAALVMVKGLFSRATAYLGLATGIFAILAVTASLFSDTLGSLTIVLVSVLTTVWFALVGFRLYRLARPSG
jgi:hypothetical protein